MVVFSFDILKDGLRGTKERHLFVLKMMQKHLAAELRRARLGFFPQETLVAEGANPWPWCVGCANPMAEAEPGDVEHLPDAGSMMAFDWTVSTCTKKWHIPAFVVFFCLFVFPLVAGLQEGSSTALASCFSELFLACTFTNKKRNLQLKALALWRPETKHRLG